MLYGAVLEVIRLFDCLDCAFYGCIWYVRVIFTYEIVSRFLYYACRDDPMVV